MYSYSIERLTKGGSRSHVTKIESQTPLTESAAAKRGAAYIAEGVAVIVSDSSVRSGWGKSTNGRAPGVAVYSKEDREYFQHLNDGGPVNM